MMKSSIPIADWGVVFTERDLEIVVIVVPDDAAFHLYFVRCRLSRKAQFSEIAHFFRKGRSKVEHELPKVEATHRSFLVCGREVHIAETPDLKGRIMPFSLANRSCAGRVL